MKDVKKRNKHKSKLLYICPMKDVKVGDTISFYTSCSADRKLFIGEVEDKYQFGLISIIDGIQYELRKLVDIKILNSK